VAYQTQLKKHQSQPQQQQERSSKRDHLEHTYKSSSSKHGRRDPDEYSNSYAKQANKERDSSSKKPYQPHSYAQPPSQKKDHPSKSKPDSAHKSMSQPADPLNQSTDIHETREKGLNVDPNKYPGSSIYSLQYAGGSTTHNTFGFQQTTCSLANRETTSPNGRFTRMLNTVQPECTIEDIQVGRVLKAQREKQMLLEIEGQGLSDEEQFVKVRNSRPSQPKPSVRLLKEETVLGSDWCHSKPIKIHAKF
jgi:hypothetical protein